MVGIAWTPKVRVFPPALVARAKVELLAKTVSMMMLEGEELPEDEVKEITSRLNDWLRGKRGEFIDLEEIA